MTTVDASSLTAIKKLRVVDLREQLSALGLPIDGVKADLVMRLSEALNKDTAGDVPQQDEGDEVEYDEEEEEVEAPAEAIAPASSLEDGEETESPKNMKNAQQKPKKSIDKQKPDDPSVSDELFRKRAERFGPVVKSSSTTKTSTAKKSLDKSFPAAVALNGSTSNNPLDLALSDKSIRKRKSEQQPKLDLADPDVLRRMKRFGLPTPDQGDVNEQMSQSQQQQKVQSRANKFGTTAEKLSTADKSPAAITKTNSQTTEQRQEFAAKMEARKARFAVA